MTETVVPIVLSNQQLRLMAFLLFHSYLRTMSVFFGGGMLKALYG
jgi:hypothetical protein